MPLHIRFVFVFLSLMTSASAGTFTYQIAGDDPGPWLQILSSIGLTRSSGEPANLSIVRNVAPGSVPQWLRRIEQGAVVVIEGDSKLSQALGVNPGAKHVVVRSIVDQRAPKLPVVWETALDTPVFALPDNAKVLAFERWEHAPVLAAIRRGSGAALWMAASPGTEGYERFPYLLQALNDLG